MCYNLAFKTRYLAILVVLLGFSMPQDAARAQAEHPGALVSQNLNQYPGFLQAEGTIGATPGSHFLLRCGINGQGQPDRDFIDFTYAEPTNSIFTDQTTVGAVLITVMVDPSDIHKQTARRLLVQTVDSNGQAIAGNCALNLQTQNWEDCHSIPPFVTADQITDEMKALDGHCTSLYNQALSQIHTEQLSNQKSVEWKNLMASKLSALRAQLGAH